MTSRDKLVDEASPADSEGETSALFRKEAVTDLFGGKRKWSSDQWIASDDRVRGGRSQNNVSFYGIIQSYLKISEDRSVGVFCGNLDIEALGGAGFSSQRTTDAAGGPWDLSKTSGLCIGVKNIDDRIYTLVVKDVILPKRPDGREQSTLSYEFSFSISNQDSKIPEQPSLWQNLLPVDFSTAPYAVKPSIKAGASKGEGAAAFPVVIFVPWAHFKPYYRGRKKPDADSLDTSKIQRLSIMCRSMFGSQHGGFSMDVEFISAATASEKLLRDSDILYNSLHSVDCKDASQEAYPFYQCSPEKLLEALQQDVSAEEEWDLIEDLKDIKIDDSSIATEGQA
ncbi:hypothetical protein ABW20_dc0100825 [Dactylellina cionopaga]|nr:hypothetical protein ABW20_dc0100825 [Dactylellina cionopaga]